MTQALSEIPSMESLRECFCFLDAQGFDRTQRLPLVTARQWKVGWEAQALGRFRRGQPNIHEVGIPKLYWRAERPQVRRLFFALTLGRQDRELAQRSELQALYSPGAQDLGPARPSWSVVARFGRYILRSHPSLSGDDFVYFGDDTLFLMEASRALLKRIQESSSQPISCLDLCCGAGGVGLALPPFEGTVRGVDLNAQAIALAKVSASSQGLTDYHYECCDVQQGLQGDFDLVFGNPPTLSPTLTGQDVFHATGTLEAFRSLLLRVVECLSERGRALFTIFSEATPQSDKAYEELASLLKGRRGFRYRVRREYPLGGERVLRHCALELFPQKELARQEFVPLGSSGIQLPAMKWRR